MTQITESDFEESEIAVNILSKFLHGGFVGETSLSTTEIQYCKETDWIERLVKYKCSYCGNWHEAPPGEERCLQTQIPVEPSQTKDGFRKKSQTKLSLDIDVDYELIIGEAKPAVDTTTLPYKTLVFVPDADEIEFSDRAGSIVFLPLNKVTDLLEAETREELITGINKMREKLIDWDSLNPNGGEFEELIFRLVSRDDDYFNESWGGTGPDQGKDGFCSIDLGGRDTRVMVQAKFNNEGSSINDKQVERSCRKASERHCCRGLIIAAVKTSGDLESEFEKGAFHTRSVNYFRLWSGPVIKEKVSEHPDLVAEYFLN